MKQRGIALKRLAPPRILQPVQYLRRALPTPAKKAHTAREQKRLSGCRPRPLCRTFATEAGPQKSDKDCGCRVAEVALIGMVFGVGLFIPQLGKRGRAGQPYKVAQTSP